MVLAGFLSFFTLIRFLDFKVITYNILWFLWRGIPALPCFQTMAYRVYLKKLFRLESPLFGETAVREINFHDFLCDERSENDARLQKSYQMPRLAENQVKHRRRTVFKNRLRIAEKPL